MISTEKPFCEHYTTFSEKFQDHTAVFSAIQSDMRLKTENGKAKLSHFPDPQKLICCSDPAGSVCSDRSGSDGSADPAGSVCSGSGCSDYSDWTF